jgi:hypothetical protein
MEVNSKTFLSLRPDYVGIGVRIFARKIDAEPTSI